MPCKSCTADWTLLAALTPRNGLMHAIEPDIRAVDVACELQGRGITFTDIRPKCAKYFRQQTGLQEHRIGINETKSYELYELYDLGIMPEIYRTL